MQDTSASLPETNIAPPFNVTRASHLVLTSRDLAASRDFYTEVIGLKVADETATTIHLRGVEERAHHSLTLKKTKEQPACERLGFRVFTEEDLERAKAHFDRQGVPARFVNVPFQGRTLHAADAAGAPLEFCARMKTLPHLLGETREHKGAAALRLDHHQVLVPAVAAAARFYMGLGFRVSDDVRAAGEHIVGISLFRKDNPHDLMLWSGAGPRLHHVGYIVQEMHLVTRALDTAAQLGFSDNVEHGPGREAGRHSYCVYLRDPDGHRIKLLLPPVQMIDSDEEPSRHEVDIATNLWGMAPPPSWFEEASPFAGVKVKPAHAAGGRSQQRGEAAPPARKHA